MQLKKLKIAETIVKYSLLIIAVILALCVLYLKDKVSEYALTIEELRMSKLEGPTAIIQSQEVSKETLNELGKDLPGRNDVKVVIKYLTRVDTFFRDAEIEQDTSSLNIKKEDNYLSLKVNYNKLNDQAYISLNMRDTLVNYVHTKKYLNPFKSNSQLVTIRNTNPYNKITHGTSLHLKERKAILVLGLQGGYDPFRGGAYLGVGITLPFYSVYSN